MRRIELDEREAEVLGEILRDYISDVRMEIADTDSQEFRDDLKQRETIAKDLLGRLERPIA